ncbi:hypothetical protein QUA56_30210 [Microcoleus sp. N3A4]|uniref:hypothetical protein n=1 Tax=Microcoleus sp. N3A4 TaxID=3055379 RepID=UPI002FD62FC1
MTKVFEITPESNPEIWAQLQPPVTDEPERPCINCDNLGFPECQFTAVGLDLATAHELSETWRRGELLPVIGHPAGDRVSDKLNQMTNQSQPIALEK